MNRIHQRLCSSDDWARRARDELIPWALKGVDLGSEVLEIGPGYGATTRVLADRLPRLTVLEADPELAVRLAGDVDGAEVVTGDGAAMPFADKRYSAVVCFTMLHHGDRLTAAGFTEVKVKKAGRVFRFSARKPS